MKYEVRSTTGFKKDYKRAIKRGLDIKKLQHVVDLLSRGEELPLKCRDHALSGNWENHRECHVLPDWLLIYQKCDGLLVLELTRTGTHADLFD